MVSLKTVENCYSAKNFTTNFQLKSDKYSKRMPKNLVFLVCLK